MVKKLPFVVRDGSVPGADHVAKARNCQDGKGWRRIIVNDKEYLVAACSDGCGSGLHTEVIASLLPLYVIGQIGHLLTFETPVLSVPAALYAHVLAYLEFQWKNIPFSSRKELVDFIKNYLLATLYGFIIGDEDSVLFHAGRGYTVVNGVVDAIEHLQGDPYPAYHLVPRSDWQEPSMVLPRSFTVVSLKTANIFNLGVATDGAMGTLPGGKTGLLLPRLLVDAFTGESGVQRWLNLINGPRNPHPEDGTFADDTTVILAERIEEAVDDNS
ncbi:MAG: hypothetical protein AAB486_00425 [Patescibacteria group bacterium]